MLHLTTGLETEAPRVDYAPSPRAARPDAATMRAMVARIVREYNAATPAERHAGATWYERAHGYARAMDPHNPERAAGVIAALSPRNYWERNVRTAAELIAWTDSAAGLAERPRIHTRAMQGQAERIAMHARPLDVLGGPKVRAFYRNIMGDLDAVTVDVWAARIALGLADDEQPPALGAAQYHWTAEAYRRAARRLGVPAAHVQATTWIHRRGSAD